MLPQLFYISAIRAMDVTAVQNEDVITQIKQDYIANKEVTKQVMSIFSQYESQAFKEAMLKTSNMILIANNPKVNDSNNFSAIKHVLGHAFYLKQELLDFKVDNNQSLGDEFIYLSSFIYQIEQLNPNNEDAFASIISELSSIITQASHYNKNDSDAMNEKSRLLINASMDIKHMAETIKMCGSLERIASDKNNTLTTPDVSNSQPFYGESGSISNELSSLFSSIYLKVFNDSMESMFSELLKTYGFTDDLKKMTYNYYIYTGILSAIDQIFSICVFMSRTDFFNDTTGSLEYSSIKKDYLTLLFHAIRQCNMNLLLIIVDIKAIRAQAEKAKNQLELPDCSNESIFDQSEDEEEKNELAEVRKMINDFNKK